MSQSATLYRLSNNSFEEFKRTVDTQKVDLKKLSRSYETFQGTFMGIEFVLSKNQISETRELILEIFTPKQFIEDRDLENIDETEDFEGFSEDILYLNPDKVIAINNIISMISEENFAANFDPIELNTNYIYPSVWNKNNSLNSVFTLTHILEDFRNLKLFFSNASKDRDYVIAFVG